MVRCLAAALVVLALQARAAAHGNEFPDTVQLFLPASHPSRILVGTNFGVVISDDDGATWDYVCEEAALPFAWGYHVGPDGTVYALSLAGIASSRDLCEWTRAAAPLGSAMAYDVTTDPADPARVLAIALEPGDGGVSTASLYQSLDGARSFGGALYTPPQFHNLTAVRAVSDTIYVTDYHSSIQPFLARSFDRGRSFEVIDLLPQIGKKTIKLLDVDRADPRRLFLKVTDADGQSLAISDDGGATARLALAIPNLTFGGFLQRADGTLLVGTLQGRTFRSNDGGASFAELASPFHVRAFAERAGRLYLSADDLRDGFALAVSDDGATSAPLLRFKNIRGPLPCAAAICAGPWAMTSALLQGKRDGGAGDGGSGGSGGACGCGIGRAPSEPGWTWLLLLLFARRMAR